MNGSQMAGKVALITGAGSGIGLATAQVFAASGVKIAVLEREQEDAERACEILQTENIETLPLQADVSDAGQMNAAVEAIEQRWDALDIVVANAGINGVWAPLEEISVDEWQQVFDVNLKGTFLTLKTSLPLLRRKGGAVAIVSSLNGTRIFSNAGASAYATTKAGQVAFARMTALELAKHRIRVNAVCPGAIKTNIGTSTTKRNLKKAREPAFYPAGRIPLTDGKSGSALQVAQVIWFLCSPLASHVTGAEVFVDGGESLLQG